MSATPSIFSYIISTIVAALLAASAFDSAPALVWADQFPRRSAQAIVDAAFSNVAASSVNRAHKSDRLPVSRADPVTNTTLIPKNAGSPAMRGTNGTPAARRIIEAEDGKPAPAPLLDCEAATSPIAGPALNRFIGRCFVSLIPSVLT
jgi:hypothetical protein